MESSQLHNKVHENLIDTHCYYRKRNLGRCKASIQVAWLLRSPNKDIQNHHHTQTTWIIDCAMTHFQDKVE